MFDVSFSLSLTEQEEEEEVKEGSVKSEVLQLVPGRLMVDGMNFFPLSCRPCHVTRGQLMPQLLPVV